MKRIINKIKDLVCLHCPECGGRMELEMLDIEIDELIYKCTECDKKWKNFSAASIIIQNFHP